MIVLSERRCTLSFDAYTLAFITEVCTERSFESLVNFHFQIFADVKLHKSKMEIELLTKIFFLLRIWCTVEGGTGFSRPLNVRVPRPLNTIRWIPQQMRRTLVPPQMGRTLLAGLLNIAIVPNLPTGRNALVRFNIRDFLATRPRIMPNPKKILKEEK